MIFWITERGEISYQIKQTRSKLIKNMVPWDGLMIITKNIDNPQLQELIMDYKDNVILHSTTTGYGGTKIEPGVSPYPKVINALNSFINQGFPAEKVVLRVDPIVPTEEGLNIAFKVIDICPKDIKRIRISFMDGYDHVKNYFKLENFHAPLFIRKEMLNKIIERYPNKEIEVCGEPGIEQSTGCISVKDYKILGYPEPKNLNTLNIRRGCMCLSSKKELLSLPKKCLNGCVYCYYRLGSNK